MAASISDVVEQFYASGDASFIDELATYLAGRVRQAENGADDQDDGDGGAESLDALLEVIEDTFVEDVVRVKVENDDDTIPMPSVLTEGAFGLLPLLCHFPAQTPEQAGTLVKLIALLAKYSDARQCLLACEHLLQRLHEECGEVHADSSEVAVRLCRVLLAVRIASASLTATRIGKAILPIIEQTTTIISGLSTQDTSEEDFPSTLLLESIFNLITAVHTRAAPACATDSPQLTQAEHALFKEVVVRVGWFTRPYIWLANGLGKMTRPDPDADWREGFEVWQPIQRTASMLGVNLEIGAATNSASNNSTQPLFSPAFIIYLKAVSIAAGTSTVTLVNATHFLDTASQLLAKLLAGDSSSLARALDALLFLLDMSLQTVGKASGSSTQPDLQRMQHLLEALLKLLDDPTLPPPLQPSAMSLTERCGKLLLSSENASVDAVVVPLLDTDGNVAGIVGLSLLRWFMTTSSPTPSLPPSLQAMLTRLPPGGNDFLDQKYQTRLVSQINFLYLIRTRNSDMPQTTTEACTDYVRDVRQRIACCGSDQDDFALSILEDSLLRLESISVG